MANNEDMGALWLKTSSKGMKFFSGTVTIDGKKTKIVVFKNGFKEENPERPDYKIYKSQPLEEKKEDPFDL